MFVVVGIVVFGVVDVVVVVVVIVVIVVVVDPRHLPLKFSQNRVIDS